MIPRPLLLLLALALGGGWIPVMAPAAHAAAAPASDSAKLERLRQRIGSLQQRLERDQTQRDTLAGELQKSETQLAELGKAVAELRARARNQEKRIAELQAEQAQAERDLQRARDGLAQQLRAAYVIGRDGRTKLLLNIDDTDRLGRTLVYYDYLQRAQAQGIRAIQARAAELEALGERLRQELDALEAARREQETALAALRSERSKRADLLSQIKRRISDGSGEVKRLQDDERALRKLIESVRENLATLPPDLSFRDQPFASLKGKLPWPVRGRTLARYGEIKAGGPLRWNGHWIGAAEGTAVRAVARGRVAYVGRMHRYGLIVLLEHEGGYYSLYGHAQDARVNVGESIKAGQAIATAGTTGGHEQPGVYFELRKGTDAIDPRAWLGR